MQVRKLNTANKQDVNQWVKFPFDLYKNSELWVPPLVGGARNALNPQKHPFYNHSTADFFLAEEKGKTLGRIALLHNTRFIEYTKQKAGHFAFFEVMEDIKVARALFETAFEMLKDVYPRTLSVADLRYQHSKNQIIESRSTATAANN